LTSANDEKAVMESPANQGDERLDKAF